MEKRRGRRHRFAGAFALLLTALVAASPAGANDTPKASFIHGRTLALLSDTQGGSRVPELGPLGSVIISFQKDEKGVGDWYKAIITEFQATHPGVTIEYTKIEQTVHADTMITLFAGGSPPDIVHLQAFDFPKIADNGWLEPLDGFIKASGLALGGGAGEDKCKWKGHTYCIMALYFGFFLAYNDDLLAQAGVTVPRNYAEWLDALRKTTKSTHNDGIIDQFGTGHEIGAGTGW